MVDEARYWSDPYYRLEVSDRRVAATSLGKPGPFSPDGSSFAPASSTTSTSGSSYSSSLMSHTGSAATSFSGSYHSTSSATRWGRFADRLVGKIGGDLPTSSWVSASLTMGLNFTFIALFASPISPPADAAALMLRAAAAFAAGTALLPILFVIGAIAIRLFVGLFEFAIDATVFLYELAKFLGVLALVASVAWGVIWLIGNGF